MAVFFSHGVSLATWDEMGLFDREVGYYKNLQQKIGEILFVTYDKPSPTLNSMLSRLRPVGALCNRWRLHYRVFGIFAPFLHVRHLRGCRLFKTNQISGAWTGVIAKYILRRPLVVRCGHVRSLNTRRRGESFLRYSIVFALERLCINAADLVFVANEYDFRYMVEKHNVKASRIKIVPNSIDTDWFKPMPEERKRPDLIIFIGRLIPEKNLELLIKACERSKGWNLRIIGSGPLENQLREMGNKSKVEFRGAVPNEELPVLINQAQAFVLPSRFEGSPKALLEAMACGLPVIGSNVPGIREIIQDNINGILCEPNVESIIQAIKRISHDKELSQRLGQEARKFVTDKFSQSRIIEKEIGHIRGLCQTRN